MTTAALERETLRPSMCARVLIPAGALFSLLPFVSSGVGLLLGAAVALICGNPYLPTTRKATQWLLMGAIVGLGAATNLSVVAQVGVPGLLQTALSIAGCLLVATLLAKALQVPSRIGLLIGVGTAICGGSAIAAVSPILRSKSEETSVALATVFLLNGLALFLFPAVGHAVGLDGHRFGVWSALAIHDTSSVVGTAMTFGQGALEVATTLKLTRALWIVPVALVLGLFLGRESSEGPRRVPMPWFLLGFIAASALATWVPAFHSTGLLLSTLAKRAMVLALFLVGAGVTRDSLRTVGMRPLLYGTVLWGIVGAASLVVVLKSP
jgi:uncharacterized integral membrane protein (TIGR00698 family)